MPSCLNKAPAGLPMEAYGTVTLNEGGQHGIKQSGCQSDMILQLTSSQWSPKAVHHLPSQPAKDVAIPAADANFNGYQLWYLLERTCSDNATP